MSRYAKLTSGLIAAWFAVSLGASAQHLYVNRPDQPPLPLGLAAITPFVLFLAWFASSRQFRDFALSLNPRILTVVQGWRTAGFVFVVLAIYGILPGMFAMPAGWGDMAIGVTAPLAAFYLANPARRSSFILWQVLGIADLVTAVALGTMAGFLDPHGISNSPMTMLPLSVVPTFIVPLMLMLHVICIAQALRWPARQASTLPQPSVA